jgi:hypothetical protein
MKHLFLVLTPLLFITSCTTKNTESVSVSGAVMPNYVTTLTEASSKIKDTKQFEDCMSPSVSMCVNQVANTIAREQNSTEICKEIPEKEAQDACAFGVVMAQAAEKKDIGMCDALDGIFKRDCRISMITQEASRSRDIKKCDAISTEIGAGTIDGRADQCRISLIMQDVTLTEKACDSLENQDQRSVCGTMVKNRPVNPNP